MTKKSLVADLLFGVQLVCGLIFGGSQFYRMLTTTQGVSITWFGFWELFLVLNLILAVRAHRVKPSRVTTQTMCSYVIWVVMVAMQLVVIIWKGSGVWNQRDTLTSILVAIGIGATLLVARYHRLTYADPIVKGWLAVFFKGVPQLTLAYNMLLVGGGGLAGIAVLNGHLSILTRLGQLGFSIREAGWDRNRIGSAISEVANEVSWLVATIVWLIVT